MRFGDRLVQRIVEAAGESVAFSAASSSTASDAVPAIEGTANRSTPSVMVPVLSVHSTSMLPRFSIA